ncbi:EAL domain-containing protein [Uliginosibacterium sp. H3]|uniref:EAL domain-containing protein n=1 Tax=Uliginosibacterium silvisoli TaxID=3114758 RepID=A0ABU6K3X8_9RHOO|nr:EAL domain-containing protein [Uliginosibacterium sp. H3]
MGARIMVVEDERIVALDLKGGLESLGYDVVGISARGADAVERAGSLRPDLILMDINLEGPMDGTEAARLIREDYRLPIVFLTAYATEKTLERAEASIPYGYLLKPFELRELAATVRMALARHKVELKVERSEERLRLAVNAASLGVWEWSSSADGQPSDGYELSPAMERLVGDAAQISREGRESLLQRIHPADRPAILEALQTQSSILASVRMRFQDEREGSVELHARVYPQGGGDTENKRVIGVIRDITEKRAFEDQLRQANVVFESTAEGILIADAQRRIISVNPAFTALTGYPAEEVLGQDPDKFLPTRREGDHFNPEPDEPGNAYWQGELACRRSDGEVFPSWQHVCVVRNELGKITHFVMTFSDISGIRKAEAQINHMAYHDALTGLGNRHRLDELLDMELPRHQAEGLRLAIIFMDLDGFKTINDTLGHTSGDLLLQVIAGRIHDGLRRSDYAIRIGGDEFVVVIPDVKRVEDCALLAEKLLKQIRTPVELPHERVSVSASMGIAIFPDNARTRQEMIKSADSAMYEAKSRGRNRYAFYSPDMAARTRERMLIEQGLVRALEDNSLTVYYQPVVDMADGSLVGMEALVRWQHPELGLVPPDRFIGVAEESGLIDGIGAWVMRTACTQAMIWLAKYPIELRLAVNVSVREMAADNFVDRISHTLQETGFPPQNLEIELTESTLQSIEHSQGLLYQLKALGVSIAIDDFGTGFSSLGLLKHLPIDRIKIDRSFVRDLPADSNDIAIARAIAAIASSLGLQMTAEGVEEKAQQQFLHELGCQNAQGYLFSRPLAREEFEQLLSGDKQNALH